MSAVPTQKRYVAYQHDQQWFVSGPNSYLIRTGFGTNAAYYAQLAEHLFNRNGSDASDYLKQRYSDTAELPYHRAVTSDNGGWVIHDARTLRISCGSGKRGSYHAKMLALAANAQFSQADWLHSTTYPRAVYDYCGKRLFDDDSFLYPDNILIQAVTEQGTQNYLKVCGIIHEKVVEPYTQHSLTDQVVDRMKAAFLDLVKKAEGCVDLKALAAVQLTVSSAVGIGQLVIDVSGGRAGYELPITDYPKLSGAALDKIANGLGIPLDALYSVDARRYFNGDDVVIRLPLSTDLDTGYLLYQSGLALMPKEPS